MWLRTDVEFSKTALLPPLWALKYFREALSRLVQVDLTAYYAMSGHLFGSSYYNQTATVRVAYCCYLVAKLYLTLW